MQRDPRYDDAATDVHRWFAGRAAACIAAGVPAERIAVDPGIGFGKTLAHNLQVIAGLARYRDLPYAVLLGVSRKSFIAAADRSVPPKQRLGGSLAAALLCAPESISARPRRGRHQDRRWPSSGRLLRSTRRRRGRWRE
ncbi:MAG: dihydropteroate synthase [Rhodospirillales bacterium]